MSEIAIIIFRSDGLHFIFPFPIISEFKFTTTRGRNFRYGKGEDKVETITEEYDNCYLGHVAGTVNDRTKSLTLHWTCRVHLEGYISGPFGLQTLSSSHLSDEEQSKSGPITRILLRAGDILDGLNFYYGRGKTPGNYFGHNGGHQYPFDLEEGEHIIGVTLYHGPL